VLNIVNVNVGEKNSKYPILLNKLPKKPKIKTSKELITRNTPKYPIYFKGLTENAKIPDLAKCKFLLNEYQEVP